MEPPPLKQQNNTAPSQAAAFALRSALANPYSQTYSSHYAQAYMQQYNAKPLTNAEGYTISSTYNASPSYQNQFHARNDPQPLAGPSRPQSQSYGNGNSVRSLAQANSSWYQAGHDRCTYRGCNFTGSAKSVEIHMMDRHLIYPPGWDKQQKQSDWDADPSLKGQPIPIQGTNLILDTPSAIGAWIEERKKRWPSSSLVADKKRKFEEASARGELSVESLGLFSKKRRNAQDSSDGDRFRGGRGRGRGAPDSGWRGRVSREPPKSNQAVRKPPPQPRKLPHNPFVARPSLLRNLLLPEIRMTVSNLSQAIRFLVDNDFLDGVELTPGEAASKPIQVIPESNDSPSLS
ncbi:hypothetical protein BDP27DRAFT_1223174 [Rhodocollybia butyracea]|uniref:FMR1-interacting protein 1 conserved domain-containing protein n=1 Tax=Rhodocollybia butyracea TaxID=206335 RepID=A0A9P5U6S1_9AGAR|nr:hypothetical protein BDP27DRAFT_1223174 [Rhodocollybia butyracea]